MTGHADSPPTADGNVTWYRALTPDELPEGRVKPVTCGVRTLCLTHFDGRYAALDNKCPHQGGPLGEGSIENGLLRCPWHGWDFDPLTGKPPGGFDDGVATFPVEIRDDGVYVALADEAPHARTVSDVMAETLVNWGVRHVFGMVGHSNLGLADALRLQEAQGKLTYYGIRHEGAASFACSAYGKLTGRPAACLSIAGPGATNLLTGLWDANVDRAPVVAMTGQVDTQVLGPGAFQEVDLMAAFGKVAQWSQPVLHTSKHAELVNLACKSAILNRGVSHLIFPDEVQKLPAKAGARPGGPAGRLTERAIAPPRKAVDDAVALLARSRRPVIIVGHGARFDMPAVLELAPSTSRAARAPRRAPAATCRGPRCGDGSPRSAASPRASPRCRRRVFPTGPTRTTTAASPSRCARRRAASRSASSSRPSTSRRTSTRPCASASTT